MNAGTIIRTICLVLALVNQILTATGHSIIPIDDETIQALVSTIATVVTALIAWWKNNDFTEEACIGTGLTRQLKAQKTAGYIGEYLDEDDEEEFIEEDEEDEQENIPTV